MKTYKIAAIPGDGIGTEVIDAGVEVLKALATPAGNEIVTLPGDDNRGSGFTIAAKLICKGEIWR